MTAQSDREAAIEALIAELEFLPSYVSGTHRGEPLPLADFTRDRITKALRDAAAELRAARSTPTPVQATPTREEIAEAWEFDISALWVRLRLVERLYEKGFTVALASPLFSPGVDVTADTETETEAKS